ncbi:hypothetical protein BS17DRAFT_284613 [Gyrodon lividus]|nr:hypothetical protein BS17DRAFT_284613 [Gyrodon lividus]
MFFAMTMKTMLLTPPSFFTSSSPPGFTLCYPQTIHWNMDRLRDSRKQKPSLTVLSKFEYLEPKEGVATLGAKRRLGSWLKSLSLVAREPAKCSFHIGNVRQYEPVFSEHVDGIEAWSAPEEQYLLAMPLVSCPLNHTISWTAGDNQGPCSTVLVGDDQRLEWIVWYFRHSRGAPVHNLLGMKEQAHDQG